MAAKRGTKITSAGAPQGTAASVLTRGIERSLAPVQQALAEEVDLIVDATYRVISRTGTIDPPIREILNEAGISTPLFYRHFRTKDELMVGLLEHGWSILSSYLSHRMTKVADAEARVSEWVRGVLAQSADPEAAMRSRPFVANLYRIATAYPDEYAASRDSLIRLLVEPIAEMRARADVLPDATAVFDLVFAVHERHLLAHTRPSRTEVEHLVGFVLAALRRDA